MNHPKACGFSQNQKLTKVWVELGLLAGVFALLYSSVFASLVHAWWENDAFSHGFFVPLISLYLIWIRRDRLKDISLEPNLAGGIAVVVIAGLIFLSGDLSSVVLLKELSLIVMIAGLILLLMGGAYLKALSFPVSYLLFMVPFLRGVTDRVYWPFQIFAAKAGTALLKAAGVPVLLESQYIELPNIKLEVAVECSGVHYLISIIAIGIPLAYLTQKTWTRKIGLVSFAVAIAIFANALRIAFIGVWAYYYDASHIHGPFHIFQGFLVSQVGFVVLFIGAWILSSIPVRSAQKKEVIKPAQAPAPHAGYRMFDRYWSAAFFILALLAIFSYTYTPKSIPLRLDLREFPIIINSWKGTELNPGEISLTEKADREILRAYRDGSGHEIRLYIGYFESQHQDKKMLNYSLMMLNRGSEQIEIPTGINGSIRANSKVLYDGNKRYSAIFWYDLNGRILTNIYLAKLVTMADAFMRGRTNGAVVVVTAPLDGSENLNEAMKVQQEFIRNISPILRSHLP